MKVNWGVEVTVGAAESDSARTEAPQTAHRGGVRGDG